MKKEGIEFLRQLIESLEEYEAELERAFSERNARKFNSIKKKMLQLNEQIEKF